MNVCSKDADLAIWGRVPPPYGGMSVHLLRLAPLLIQSGISFKMYSVASRTDPHPWVVQASERRIRWLTELFSGQTEEIYYVLGQRPVTLLAASLIKLKSRKKIILRVGSELRSDNIFSKLIYQFSYQSATKLIAVNKKLCDQLIRMGVNHKKVHHIPGFIPPIPESGKIPSEIDEFLESHSPILTASGNISKPGGFDTWGLWMLPKLIRNLIHHYPKLGLVIYYYVPHSLRREEYWIHFHRELEKNGLTDNVFLYQSQSEMWPIFRVADLYLRPSLTDGDSNSVRESLFFGVPVVASDCVQRPDPTITFKSMDQKEFLEKVLVTLKYLPQYKKMAEETIMENNGPKVVEIIKSLRDL